MKKIALTLGTLIAVSMPIVATVACGSRGGGSSKTTDSMGQNNGNVDTTSHPVVGNLPDGTPYYGTVAFPNEFASDGFTIGFNGKSWKAWTGNTDQFVPIIGYTKTGFAILGYAKDDLPKINVKKGDEVISYDGQGYPVTEKNMVYPNQDRQTRDILESYASKLLALKGEDYFKQYSSHDKTLDATSMINVDDGYIIYLNVAPHVVFDWKELCDYAVKTNPSLIPSIFFN